MDKGKDIERNADGLIEVLFKHLPGWTKKNNKQAQDGFSYS